ncbi:MAG TPA: hypothetical protein DCX61_03165 [Gemmatimonadetes bacterium]|nr:hypothetical protein [Gemmatimonadota bacterium]
MQSASRRIQPRGGNDVAIAAATLIEERVVEQVLIVDLDVHRGSGTVEAALA